MEIAAEWLIGAKMAILTWLALSLLIGFLLKNYLGWKISFIFGLAVALVISFIANALAEYDSPPYFVMVCIISLICIGVCKSEMQKLE